MLEGRFFGTMTLSEPHAGSSLGDVVTRAVPADDGTYRIFGSKMWISGGDHEMGDNIVHLVLAKLPDAPAGSRGISLFIVPKWLVDRRRLDRRAQRRRARRHQPQAGQPRHRQHGAGLRRRRLHAGRCRRGRRLPRRRAPQGPLLHVPHDERRPPRRRDVGDHHGLHGLPQVARLRPLAPPGPAADRRRPDRAAGADHPARRRAPDAAGAEVLRRGRAGAQPLLLAAARRAGDGRGRRRAPRRGPAPRRADADREVVALAVGPGEQQPGDPGARRLGLHPRLRRRGALARPAAEPDPRGHPRHPGAGPARPQGARRGRRLAAGAGRPDRGDRRPRDRRSAASPRRTPSR